MSAGAAAFLFAAAIVAGAVNSVAGGGTLLSFPAAMAAGLPPIVANATNSMALVPGSLAAAWTFRRRLAGLGRLTALLAVPAVAGALTGAWILRHTPQRLFDDLVPWLVLGATLIILIQGAIVPKAAGEEAPPAPGGRLRLAALLFLQLLVGIYGGYFGAAMGILMLAFLGQLPAPGGRGRLDIHQMNAVKNVLGAGINGAASIDFLAHGLVSPIPAAVLAAGAITGGVIGSRLAGRARPHQVRRLVVGIGLAMAALLAWRRYGG